MAGSCYPLHVELVNGLWPCCRLVRWASCLRLDALT
jgi:hypothetical protein